MEDNLSDSELLELQAAVLFVHDENGRLRSVNEPATPVPPAAPRFFWGRTRAGSLSRFRYDLPADVVDRLTRVVAAEPTDDDLAPEPRGLMAACEILAEHAPLREIYCGPAYRFPDQIDYPAGVVAITEENQNLLGPDDAWLLSEWEGHQPCFAIVVDGRTVSLCNTARSTARAAEAGLATTETFRGRGYGPRVTAAWAAAVRAQGRIPLYSTWWANVASQAVARKLGLSQYGVDLHLT